VSVVVFCMHAPGAFDLLVFFFAVIELELEGKRTVWFVRHHTHATYDGALYIQILVLRTTVLTGTAGYVLNCRSEHNERCFPLINIHYGR
jgi:hypothetical protein